MATQLNFRLPAIWICVLCLHAVAQTPRAYVTGKFVQTLNGAILRYTPDEGEDPTPKNVLVNSNTKVVLDGKPSSLSALRVGVSVRFPVSESDGIVVHIDAFSVAMDDKFHSQAGTVESLKGPALTVSQGQNHYPLTLTGDTTITLDGKPAEPADLRHGMIVTVTYRDGNVSLVQAVTVEMDGASHRCEGDFVSCSADELVIHVWGQDGFDVKLKPGPDFKITRNDKPAAMGDFTAGEHIVANYTDGVAKDLALLPAQNAGRGVARGGPGGPGPQPGRGALPAPNDLP